MNSKDSKDKTSDKFNNNNITIVEENIEKINDS